MEPLAQLSSKEDSIYDDLGTVIRHGDRLKEVVEPTEQPADVPMERIIGIRESLYLSFNRHKIIEAAAGALALSGLGFVIGGSIFHHRRTLATAP